jgi:selenide,water dikinase
LRRLPVVRSSRVLVGTATGDDAGVYRLDRDRALVQTVDFFTPIVDDPYLYGQIAATNSLSDVYAMGGRPLTALNLLGAPDEGVSASDLRRILLGGARKMAEAGCLLVGGHSVRNPEPFYGLSVTGLVSPRRMITNADARPGDWLVLTKPLGTGVVTTAIKRGIASAALVRRAVAAMRHLNVVGAELAEHGWVKAGTDITGFGLLGHLGSLCRASCVGAELRTDALPILGPEVWSLIAAGCVPGGTRKNLDHAATSTDFQTASEPQRLLAADAQTSGGLLLCVPPARLAQVLDLLRRRRTPACSVIGRIVKSASPSIRMTAGAKPR